MIDRSAGCDIPMHTQRDCEKCALRAMTSMWEAPCIRVLREHLAKKEKRTDGNR